MYLAGYRCGLRFAGVESALAYEHARIATDGRDPYCIRLGILDYSAGFLDGWHLREQSVAGPLEQGP